MDDDNVPSPENVPLRHPSNGQRRRDKSDIMFEEWGHDGVCQQRQVEGRTMDAKIFNFGSYAGVPTILQTFEMLFPQGVAGIR